MSEEARGPRLLQQFARLPVPGRVKTRLARSIGAAAACAVHEELFALTARTLLDAALAPVELWLDEGGTHGLLEPLMLAGMHGPFEQIGQDLGERMHRSLVDGLQRYERVVLVGSDCPGLDEAYLRAAFDALDAADAVIGPAEDGGYVLIGARRNCAPLFADIPWGTAAVLERSRAAAEIAELDLALLTPRYDIDVEADLLRWRSGQGKESGAQSA
ncbi:MAG: TIGR04282 family arsenosugar biosynthesis glycosyltransferase [Pseudomonadota bacterium]